MKQDIKLYIDDKLVDFSSEIPMPFVYQLEDTNNPTIIKNYFTKTISIVGTKNNNKIFGDIYNFDRTQMYDDTYLTGVYFNPSFRTPFQLFKNGELLESGYMQLNSITLKNKLINYDVTLYGGLGDFFYSLMYNKNNEKLKLSDLVYGVQDSNGNTIEPDKEMDFNINAHFVKESWNYLDGNDDKQLRSYISFIPAYNGIYENFDNNKVLINTHNSSVFNKLNEVVDGVEYATYNGYALGELKNDMNEWEIRDLRSYMQRPALRLKRLFEAICNPVNNGGYEVELDNDFFNAGNPYYEKAYISLPQFSSVLENKEEESYNQDLELYDGINVGVVNGTEVQEDSSYVIPIGEGPLSANGFEINVATLPVGTMINSYVDLRLSYNTDTTQDNLYDSAVIMFPNPVIGAIVPVLASSSTCAQVIAYDKDDNVVGYSNVYSFTNHIEGYYYKGVQNKPYEAPVTYINGHWQYREETNLYHFFTEDGYNTFRLEMNNLIQKSKYKIKMYVWREFFLGADFVTVDDINAGALFKSILFSETTPPEYAYGEFTTYIDGKITTKVPSINVYTNSIITKQKLLKTENTPADYLLSYCKLFGLYFSKDNSKKKIYIRQRNNFFTNNTIDWSSRIDYSKDIKINPITFDKKFYKFALKNNDGYYDKKYSKEYTAEYGQKRVNTAYNFNSETIDLLKDNVYENSIPILDSSQYYRLYYDNLNIEVPTFMIDGINYKLFNVSGTDVQTTDIDMPTNVNFKTAVNLNEKSGYDLFPKQAFFNVENNIKSLNDINSSLLFYCGKVSTVLDSEGTKVKYWLTDDKEEMGLLNNDKRCYIYTESVFDEKQTFVGYKLEELPQFLTYNINLNNVRDSLDFGVPKETYIPNINYYDSATIYNRYWADFYADQLDINTKKITCYVNLEGINVNGELLRNFYYFNNSVWLLNKINNYNPNSVATTQCEFIKIQNTNNYTKAVGTNYDYLTADVPIAVAYQSGRVAITVNSSVNWKIGNVNNNIISISETNGEAGETIIYIDYKQNNDYADKSLSFTIEDDNNIDMRYVVDIKQLPNFNNVIVMSGVVKSADGFLDDGKMIITNNRDTIYSTVDINRYTGEYTTYIPKGVGVVVEIEDNNTQYKENIISPIKGPIHKDFTIPLK